MFYKELLKDSYKLFFFKNVNQINKFLTDNEINLMLLDLMLSKEDCFGLLNKIKCIKKCKNLKIIVISCDGYADQLKKIYPDISIFKKSFDKKKILNEIKNIMQTVML